jgi:hypothetical protein
MHDHCTAITVHSCKNMPSMPEIGAGSGRTSFAWVGSFINSSGNLFPSTNNNLLIVDQGLNNITLNASMMTEWGGQAGAAFTLVTTMYNG